MSERPLRVAHFNSMLTGGGTDDQCVKLVYGLCQLGQDARILGPDGREFSKVVRQLQIPFQPTPSEGPLKIRLVLAAARIMRHAAIQVLHAHHGRDLWPAILAARLSGCRPAVILTRHLAKSPSSWFSRSFLLGQCDGLIAVSNFVAKVLREGVFEPDSPEPERRERPPLRGDFSKIHVIHPGIDTERFYPFEAGPMRESWGVAPAQFVFAVVGGYDRPRGKGQREFLKAAAEVHRQIPQARFLVIGRGNLKATLEADIRELGLQDKAWLTPYSHDMPSTMNALDCLVHPQVGTEAFGAVLLEAFACGKPVIASALDGIPEAFAAGQRGQLIAPEDIPALAAALIAQAKLPGLSLNESQALHQEVAAQYSVAAMAAKVLAFYHQLIKSNQP